MFKGCIKMDIDKLKNEFKKMRVPKMDISINEVSNMKDFFQKIKTQDKDDEKYILHNRIIPIIVGLFLMIILMLINPIKSVLLLTGMFLIFTGLIYTLILSFLDYKNITKESYDFSLFAYLKQKEERLKSWRSTPAKYKWTFTVFVSGLIFMVIGNTSLMRDFDREYIILFIVVYLCLLVTFWTIGEYFYRKRHRQKHQPLIKSITQLLKELGNEESNI
jgi:cell division protein FtsW (lipid II flippase)